MNRSILKLFFIGLTLFTVQSIFSQHNLNESDKKKISVAERKIKKAESIVKKADKYTSQIEILKNDGKVRTGKIQRLETKANNIIIKSSSFYKDGYGKKYETYQSAVERYLKDGSLEFDFESNKNEARKTYKTGRKWRRKSKSQANVDKGVEYLLKANEVEGSAIEALENILTHVNSNDKPEDVIEEELTEATTISEEIIAVEPTTPIVAEAKEDSSLTVSPDTLNTTVTLPEALIPTDTINTPVISQDTLTIAFNDTASVDTPITETAKIDTEPIVDEVAEPEQAKDLTTYFTIQFLADKQPVPKEKITSIYNGPVEVIKHEADGWFRYSIGRYSDINNAKETLQSTGVKGYVVAYHNNNRISTREAIEILSGI